MWFCDPTIVRKIHCPDNTFGVSDTKNKNVTLYAVCVFIGIYICTTTDNKPKPKAELSIRRWDRNAAHKSSVFPQRLVILRLIFKQSMFTYI